MTMKKMKRWQKRVTLMSLMRRWKLSKLMMTRMKTKTLIEKASLSKITHLISVKERETTQPSPSAEKCKLTETRSST